MIEGLPIGARLNGQVEVIGPPRRLGAGLAYPARLSGDPYTLWEFWPADLYRRGPQGEALPREAAFGAVLEERRQAFLEMQRAAVQSRLGGYWQSEANGTAYVAWLTTPTLEERLVKDGLDREGVLRLAKDLARALQAAHDQGLLHLDIGPETVRSRPDGWGLAAFSPDRRPLMALLRGQEGLVRPGYAPLELHDGSVRDPVGPGTDLYMLSALIALLITGREPRPAYESRPAFDWPSGWPEPLLRSLERGLRPDLGDRPASVADWAGDWLDRDWPEPAAPSAPAVVTTPVEPAPSRARKGCLRGLLGAGVLGAAAIAIALGQGLFVDDAYYAVREIRLREAPSTARSVGYATEPRGYRVQGELVEGAAEGELRWLRVTDGPYEGRYVSFDNLGDDPPPEIEPLPPPASAWRRLGRDAVLTREPGGGEVLERLEAGAVIGTAVGLVEGRWVELTWRGGGVGYLPRDAFETPATVRLDDPSTPGPRPDTNGDGSIPSEKPVDEPASTVPAAQVATPRSRDR